MKFKIEYQPIDSKSYPFGAKTKFGDEVIFGVGISWDMARLDLLDKLRVRGVNSKTIPEPEEIEIEVKDE
jgi:hypothetical protein